MTTKSPTNAGVIVALLPDADYVSMRPTTSDHHLTVLYLGRLTDEEINPKALTSYWKNLMKLWDVKIEGEITAETMFHTPDGWAHVDLVNAPYLPDFRSLAQELLDVHGLPLGRTHGFIPHITRRYIRASSQIEFVHRKEKPKLTLDRLAIWAGETRYVNDLT